MGGTNHPALYSDFIITETPHWISSEPSELNSYYRMLHCNFRFQHRDALISCIVHKNLKNQLMIHINQPLRSLTEGQVWFLYV